MNPETLRATARDLTDILPAQYSAVARQRIQAAIDALGQAADELERVSSKGGAA